MLTEKKRNLRVSLETLNKFMLKTLNLVKSALA